MPYRVRITPPARREFVKLPHPTQERLDRMLRILREDARPPGCTQLAGAERLYRVRAGDYRIIYRIEDDALVVTVVRIAHRRDVYRER